MSLLYPTPAITGIADYLGWANTLTGYYFGPAIVAGFFLVMFVAMKRFPTEKAFLASSFLSALLSFFMFIINLVSIETVMVCTIATLAGVYINYKSEGSI